MFTSRSMHSLLSLLLAAGLAAAPVRAQTPHATAGSPQTIVAVDGEDELLHGITLTTAQRQRLDGVWQEQLAENEASRPRLDSALTAMRIAHARGDDDAARAILAAMQTTMAERRMWWLGAARLVLTPEQRQRFDANFDALVGEEEEATPNATGRGAM